MSTLHNSAYCNWSVPTPLSILNLPSGHSLQNPRRLVTRNNQVKMRPVFLILTIALVRPVTLSPNHSNKTRLQFPLAFTSLAIYAAHRASNYSLPTFSLTHTLAIILPFLTYSTLYTFTSRPSPHYLIPPKSSPMSRLQSLVPNRQISLIVLFILDSLLLTLASTALSPSTFNCALERRWVELFRAKNESAIRAIQDQLECCGFRAVKDKAWPFPAKGVGAGACAERYGRTRPCEVPWSAVEREVLRTMIGVGVGVVVLKASHSPPGMIGAWTHANSCGVASLPPTPAPPARLVWAREGKSGICASGARQGRG